LGVGAGPARDVTHVDAGVRIPLDDSGIGAYDRLELGP
jgi:hypothetical protein